MKPEDLPKLSQKPTTESYPELVQSDLFPQ